MKTIVKKYANGQKEVIHLGKEKTCVSAEPRGWGTSCKTLILKLDGYYHCNDCGLVFKKPALKEKPKVIPIKCKCKELSNCIEWYLNEYDGKENPSSYYKCNVCELTYQAPYYSREAPLRFQESEAAKKHVLWHREFKRKKQKELTLRIEEAIKELKGQLNRLSKSKRKRLLSELKG